MKTLLLVDDERLFTQSLAEGLRAVEPSYRVLTAENGAKALEALAGNPVDLVLTDLKMPVMDGFELLTHLSQKYPELPVIVMTAFGTPEISGQLLALGIPEFIEKPVDFEVLCRRISTVLESSASGFVRGIPLSTFLQIIEIERKTCVLKVFADDRSGLMYLSGGALFDAETEGETGEPAARTIVSWESPSIEIKPLNQIPERRIKTSIGQLLLDTFRLRDEARAGHDEAEDIIDLETPKPGDPRTKEEREMSVSEKLKELASVDGFAGAGVYTPTGEPLSVLNAGTGFSKEIGILANNVLMNAQKASIEMGSGRGEQVHIEAEKAHIFARCLNEGTDPLKSQPGKAHIHLVVAFANDASIGMVKLRVNSVIGKLAEDFRL
jgi:CheY-like chemotaxis protein